MRNSSLQLPAWGNRIPTGIFYANWQSPRALKGTRGEASPSSQTDSADGFCLFASKCVLTKWQSWVGTNFHLNLVVILLNSDCLSPHPHQLPCSPQTGRFSLGCCHTFHPYHKLLRFRLSSSFYSQRNWASQRLGDILSGIQTLQGKAKIPDPHSLTLGTDFFTLSNSSPKSSFHLTKVNSNHSHFL